MSKPVPVFPVDIRDGKLHLSQTQRQALARWCRVLKDCEGELVLRKKRSKRSLDQSAYWWSVPVRLMAEEWGETPERAHYLLLGEWKGYSDGPKGQRIPNCCSSSSLSTAEFSELITWVLDYGPSEWHVYIPAPNEVEWRAA